MLKNKKGLYVISRPIIENLQKFSNDLTAICQSDAKPVLFQLRLKNVEAYDIAKTIEIALPICQANGVEFILNDDIKMASEFNVGAHIGENDDDKEKISRFIASGRILGVSCYGDVVRAKYYADLGASYVSFGAFYDTNTKTPKARPPLSIISEFKKQSDVPVCAIGGIKKHNIQNVVDAGADLIAVVTEAWDAGGFYF